MNILKDDKKHSKLSAAKSYNELPTGHFGFDEYDETYDVVERINVALKAVGFEIERVASTKKGCYDPPYYFKIKPETLT